MDDYENYSGPAPNGRALNLEDIAAKAGVSRSTVSRVVNNEPYVSQKTRDRVMAVIEREGYVPNPAARMLVTQRTHVIGVVIPETLDVVFEDAHYFPTLLQGVADTANARDYAMLLWMQENPQDAERIYERILKNRLMDGLVIGSSTTDAPGLKRLLESDIPVVMVERPYTYADRISSVTIENLQASKEAVQHLIRLGYRRIGTLTGALNNVDGIDRLEGYKQALAEAGLPILPELIYEGRFMRLPGYINTKQLLKHHPDAIFIANNQTALGVLDAIAEAGLRVPQDVALVTFDDLPSITHTKPPLTAVRQPIREKGAQAAALLLDQIEGVNTSTRHMLLPTQLVIRESCGAMLRSRPTSASM